MTVPNPMGCRLCGIDQRGHGIQATAAGSHAWQKPTQQQIKDRMLARHPQEAPVAVDPFDNSAEAWEEDWDDSPQLGGMGEELRQLHGD
ncbi:hypothetical protein AB0C88_37640 [Streptomyces chartreusis]|uniref:hypothetical protein n=1 Tax=Streptomyces chartreusis TaxID=1969 RepID=UPI0033EBAC78